MAYTVNSAKDSRGDEDQFVADFNRNIAAITAYKQRSGGDLEHAYQAVTGKPWPAGRSVKITNGQAEMTKDRTVKSVLGKVVAPAAGIAAAAFGVPGLFPGFLGGGGPAAAGGAGYVSGAVNSVADAATAAVAGGGTVAGTAAGLTPSILGSLKSALKNPKDIASLVALVPALRNTFSSGSNGNDAFGANSPFMAEAQKSLALGNQRMQQVQPVYDALVNQTYGRMPKRYRGPAPAGYTGNAPPEGAYQYQAPRFG